MSYARRHSINVCPGNRVRYITMTGDKRFLGVVETDTENEKVLTPFLRSLVERGLDVSQGLLVIVDGGKGLRAAVRKAFRHRALVQRCQWHKRENVVSYVAKSEQPVCRQRLQRAYNQRWTLKLGQLAKVESSPRKRSLECHGRDGVIPLS